MKYFLVLIFFALIRTHHWASSVYIDDQENDQIYLPLIVPSFDEAELDMDALVEFLTTQPDQFFEEEAFINHSNETSDEYVQSTRSHFEKKLKTKKRKAEEKNNDNSDSNTELNGETLNTSTEMIHHENNVPRKAARVAQTDIFSSNTPMLSNVSKTKKPSRTKKPSGFVSTDAYRLSQEQIQIEDQAYNIINEMIHSNILVTDLEKATPHFWVKKNFPIDDIPDSLLFAYGLYITCKDTSQKRFLKIMKKKGILKKIENLST